MDIRNMKRVEQLDDEVIKDKLFKQYHGRLDKLENEIQGIKVQIELENQKITNYDNSRENVEKTTIEFRKKQIKKIKSKIETLENRKSKLIQK